MEKVESQPDSATAPVKPLLCRLVVVDRRSRLGVAAAAASRILATEALQYRLLQERKVDGDIKSARPRRQHGRKAKFYQDAQETIWNDTPWAPLVTEKLLSAQNKKLTGVYMMPDASFNFTEIDLKP